MLTGRRIEPEDNEALEASLAEDDFHAGTEAAFFYTPEALCNVYEDEGGPVLFLRGTKALRIDVQFMDNRSFERNRQAISAGLPGFIQQAKAAGFTELIFNTTSTLLRRFCERQFGFKQSADELRLHI